LAISLDDAEDPFAPLEPDASELDLEVKFRPGDDDAHAASHGSTIAATLHFFKDALVWKCIHLSK
jgi:hypothetical protein